MAHIDIDHTATLLKVLAEPIRLRILHLLGARELCVCEIVAALGEPQYKISRHLAALREAGLLKGRREGTWMHYAFDPGADPAAMAIVRAALAACADGPPRAACAPCAGARR